LISTLQSKCNACFACSTLLLSQNHREETHEFIESKDFSSNVDDSNVSRKNVTKQKCAICLGIFSPYTRNNSFAISQSCSEDMKNAIQKYMLPYIQDTENSILNNSNEDNVERKAGSQNIFHSDYPSVRLPSDLYVRGYAAISYLRTYHKNEFIEYFGPNCYLVAKLDEFISRIKDAIKNHVREFIVPDLKPTKNTNINIMKLPNEEGRLSVHIIFQTLSMYHSSSKHISESIVEFPPASCFPVNIRPAAKKIRKRFRGEDPTPKQGGSPIDNIEKRLKKRLNQQIFHQLKENLNGNEKTNNVKDDMLQIQSKFHPVSMATIQKAILAIESAYDKDDYVKKLEDWFLGQVKKNVLSPDSLISQHKSGNSREDFGFEVKKEYSYEVSVAIWRNPFYVKGRYTKNRRDVSQSPFYVAATVENDSPDTPMDKNDTQNNKRKTRLVKKGITSVEEQICSVVSDFACGGISLQNNYDSDDDGDSEDCVNNPTSPGKIVYGMCKFHASGREDIDVRMLGTGRPFVLEIIDAHTLPTIQSLHKAAEHLNLKFEPVYGVGIDGSNLLYGNAKNFSGLQAETENKVKHYGCMCWSEKIIPTQDFLDAKFSLPSSDTSSNRIAISKENPLKIIQATPVRVLHRRSAANRERYIVSMKSKRINDHWFQLWVSTSAGTYVKEFVRGDLGRTTPSVASMLNDGDDIPKKADILQLDVICIEDHGFNAGTTIR